MGWMVFILVVFAALLFFWFFPVLIGGIPWQPTDMRRVRKMLTMAQVKPNEVVYDLGCGDGRIVIAAVREFGAKAVGVEANPWLYLVAWIRIFLLGLWRSARVVLGNLYHQDLSQADVITLFLFQHVNDRLEEKLKRELKPGARVVSYVWVFKNWEPSQVDTEGRLYLYEKERGRENVG